MPAEETTPELPPLTITERHRIAELLAALPARNPVRQSALGVLENRPLLPANLFPLLAALRDSSVLRWKERVLAAWVLGHLPLTWQQQADAADVLLDVLDDRFVPDVHRVWKGLGWSIVTAALGVGGVLALLSAYLPGVILPLFTRILCLGPPVVLFLLFCPPDRLARIFAAEDERSDRVRAEAACSLGRLRAAEAVGGLAEAIYDRNGGVGEAAQRAFPDAVSALIPEHYGMMESRTTPHLCRVLYHRDLETARAALQALWMVGDGRAVEPVARFAASGRNSRLADSASALIPVLKERSRRVMAPATLLRAADPATVQDQTLLRPATVLLKAASYVQETFAAADAESDPEARTASHGS